ncbi:daptide-type RiPP biosynthesis dehydogenase [Lentzea sp. BCCO 10_0061]|uniref:Daptide-type RiPP biosynthesis dehydogenase n=1 Tax=Lentzea sokolovensis TaxID=3095429 RepID=A0ABU4V5A0_9PSEU|nr:daptide-type RiPP biosynthesis dehydogenase [Lentzea sp. BCCO 10_0061]MDX8146961.1 daptide-type RiPP biosynthesis dehydogenase [Lentzea sp. BCCO 10_0061]
MMLRRACPTTVHAGARAWRSVNLGRRPLIVTDAGLSFSFDVPTIRLDTTSTDLGTVRALSSQIADHAPDVLVGVGGGAVLDVVKLAGVPDFADVLEARGQRAGVVGLPNISPAFRRVFVPTTIGTGAEVSPVACVRIGVHRRLAIGNALAPESAVLDPAFTETLPPVLLREGVLEALLRVVGPFVGSPRIGGLPDAEAEMLVRQLVAVGERLASGDVGPDVRLTAATLSAATHTGWALVGRDTYGAKHWYLANELSTVLGVRKMIATAAVVPAVWTRIMAGDRRYGDAGRLVEAWSWISDGTPVSGLHSLLRRWDLAPSLVSTADQRAEASRRAERSWGGRLPMLADLTAADVEEVYASCST